MFDTYEIKGIALDRYEMHQVHAYYEASCTAEYLLENYNIEDKEEALALGYEVRYRMMKYDWDEETAIDDVLGGEGYVRTEEE